jgi:fibronectin-binding autotransporter adhesin
MKNFARPQRKSGRSAVILSLVCFANLPSWGAASTINWNAVSVVTADTDVSNVGAADRAWLFGGGSTTINGVTFTTFGGGDTQSGLGNGYGGYGEGSPFGNLSAAYKTLLTNGYYGSTTGSVTLNNLNIGLDYQVQAWVNDSRGCCAGRSESISGSGSLLYSNSGAGGVGSFVTGNFTADATNQVLSITADASAQINGLQLRATGVSPGNTATITSAKNWTALTIGSGGTIKYNLAASAQQSTALSGSGSLEKSGTGVLTLTAAQAYTGATNITSGTLRPATATGSTLWLDAAKTSSLTTSGTAVSQWNDAAGGINFASQGTAAARPNLSSDNAFTGVSKAMVDFGATGSSGQTMIFNNNLTDIRSVFWIMKGGNFLLGSTGAYDFHRDGALDATSDIWHPTYAAANIQNGQTYLDGTLVNGTTTPLSGGYQMIDLVTAGNVQANSLANDRNIGGRIGGQQIGEVIIFNSALTTTERQRVESYLNYKWFAIGSGVGDLLPVTTAVSISGGGTLDLSGVNYQTVGSLASADTTSQVTLGSAAFTVGDATDTSFAGIISEGGSLVKQGAGTLTLTNANTYTGPTSISAGTLELGGTAGSLGTNTGAVANQGTLKFNRSNALSFNNAITGAGAVTQAGSGTTTLGGANTYSGATSVSGGMLQLNGAAAGTLSTASLSITGGNFGFTAGALSTLDLTGKPLSLGSAMTFDLGAPGSNDTINVGSFTLTANSSLNFNALGALANGGSYTLINSTNAIATGGFTLTGQTVGKLTLTPTVNTNTVTLNTVLLQGIWNQTGGGNWSNGNPSATGGNWTNYKPTVAGDAALFGSAITAAATVTVDTAHALGFMTFDNANSYTLGTNGSSNLTLDNSGSAALISLVSGNHTIAENVTLTSSVAVVPGTGTGLTISGNLSGAGGVQLSGAGNLTLSGANTFTGGTTVSAGVLKAGSTTAFGTAGSAVAVSGGGAIDINGMLLPYQPTISGSGVDANTGAVFTTVDAFNSGFAALTLSGNASIGNNGGRFDIGRTAGSTTQGNGFTLTKVGNNVIGVLAAAVNLGGVVINGGTLQPEINTAFANAPITINNGGVLSPYGGLTMTNALTINAGGTLRENQGFNDVYSGAVTLGGAATADAASGSITLNGSISGGGTLTKTGTSTLTLGGNNTHTNTVVSAGILKAASDTALGASGATVSISSGASLDINARTLQGYTQNIQIAGPGVSSTFGALGNSGGVNLNAIRGITLTADASVGDNGGRWDIGRLDFNADPNITSNHIDGGGFVLTKVGSGALALLTGATNLAGFVINGGVVTPHENTSFGAGPVTLNTGILQAWGGLNLANAFTFNGGTVQTDGFNDNYNGPITMGGPTTINPYNGAITFNGNVSGNGALTKTGGNQLVFTGNNTQTGLLTVNGGSVRFASTIGNATQGNVEMINPGSFLIMAAPNQFGPSSGVLFNSASHSEMALYGNNQTIASLASTNQFAVVQNSHGGIGPATANSTLTVNQSTDTVYSGYIRDNTGNDAFKLSLTKSGSGKLTLEGGNLAYTGLTTISNGTLALGTGASLPDNNAVVLTSATSSFDISAITAASDKIGSLNSVAGSTVNLGPKTLEFGDANDALTAGNFSGTGGITKSGSAIQTVSGVNTYTGSTNLNAGTLLLASTTALPATASLVLSTGTTLNTGGLSASTGQLSVNGDSVLDLGAGSGSQLTFADSGTWTGILSIWNYTGGAAWTASLGDKLTFTNQGSIDLTKVRFYSDNGGIEIGTGGAGFIAGNELVPVPEPGAAAAALLLLGCIGYRERRRVRR